MGRSLIRLACSLFILAVSQSECSLFDRFVSSPSVWGKPKPPKVPGGTGLRFCDDPWGWKDSIFEIIQMEVEPQVPIIEEQVNFTAFGYFRKDILENATHWYFLVSGGGAVAGWGNAQFCNLTRVEQSVDGLTQENCPPDRGLAVLRLQWTPEFYWTPGEWFLSFDSRSNETREADRIFCVEGWMDFERASSQRSLFSQGTSASSWWGSLWPAMVDESQPERVTAYESFIARLDESGMDL